MPSRRLIVTCTTMFSLCLSAQEPAGAPATALRTVALLAVRNRCEQPHWFRVTPGNVREDAVHDPVVQVPARGIRQVWVTLQEQQTSSSARTSAVQRCLDCKPDDRCAVQPTEVTFQQRLPMAAPPAAETRVMSSASATSAHDVGVIAQPSGVCPPGSSHLYISMDDEDKNNKSSVSGWTGDISTYSTGTTFGFCRVDGSRFRALPGRDFAVLQLSANCPSGATSILRRFDNENANNANWASGSTDPNKVKDGDWHLNFCFFRQDPSSTATGFPDFYAPYGVFAAPPSPAAGLPTGTVATDDNDTAGDNLDYTMPLNGNFALIVFGTDKAFGGKNSKLLVAQASSSTSYVSGPDEVRLRHQQSGKCLYVDTSTTPAMVKNWTCWKDPNMAFVLEDAGNGEVRLRHKLTNQCIFGNPSNGAPVAAWPCWADPNMTFAKDPAGGTAVRLRHKNTQKCLYGHSVNGGTANNWACWADPNMAFVVDAF